MNNTVKLASLLAEELKVESAFIMSLAKSNIVPCTRVEGRGNRIEHGFTQEQETRLKQVLAMIKEITPVPETANTNQDTQAANKQSLALMPVSPEPEHITALVKSIAPEPELANMN